MSHNLDNNQISSFKETNISIQELNQSNIFENQPSYRVQNSRIQSQRSCDSSFKHMSMTIDQINESFRSQASKDRSRYITEPHSFKQSQSYESHKKTPKNPSQIFANNTDSKKITKNHCKPKIRPINHQKKSTAQFNVQRLENEKKINTFNEVNTGLLQIQRQMQAKQAIPEEISWYFTSQKLGKYFPSKPVQYQEPEGIFMLGHKKVSEQEQNLDETINSVDSQSEDQATNNKQPSYQRSVRLKKEVDELIKGTIYLRDRNKKDRQAQTIKGGLIKLPKQTVSTSQRVIAEVWYKMAEQLTSVQQAPDQINSISKDISQIWNSTIRMCTKISLIISKSKSYSQFADIIQQFQVFLSRRIELKNTAESTFKRCKELIQFFQSLGNLNYKSHPIWDVRDNIGKFCRYFHNEEKTDKLPHFMSLFLKFLLKKYFKVSYQCLSSDQKENIDIRMVFQCVDLLFKHSINKKIENFFSIKNDVSYQSNKQQLQKLKKMLEEIKKSYVYFCKVFEDKYFPWLGNFVNFV